MKTKALLISLVLLLALFAASCGKSSGKKAEQQEDRKAMAMLEGIWLDSDESTPTFWIKGDTVYYPDSTSQPMAFKIIADTLIFYGNSVFKYPIIKQMPHLLEFRNPNGDIVKLVKSDDPNDSLQFVRHAAVVINQNTLIKRDTVVTHGAGKYHCYVQVNPTTYKVYRTSYNNEGLEVENVYYDNIIHIGIYSGANKLYSKDFRKSDFSRNVAKDMLSQCVLSDMKLNTLDESGIHYFAQLAVPDSPSSFIVEVIISYKGKMTMRVDN